MMYIFLFLEVVLILAKRADPDEMQHSAAFHLGLPCLPNYPFYGVQTLVFPEDGCLISSRWTIYIPIGILSKFWKKKGNNTG